MADNRSIRSSQLLSPYGTGSIVDIGDESLLLTDLSGWPKYLEEIHLDRLANELGVNTLRAPPKQPEFGQKENRSVTAIRFPHWMFCPSCRKMEHWINKTGQSEDNKPVCKSVKCKKRKLVPMRFVMACEHGHLEDIPWDYWAHSHGNDGACGDRNSLFFESSPSKGSGLDALSVQCKACGSERHLGRLPGPNSMPSLGVQCKGRQPWEPKNVNGCESPLVVLQRGASNLYYPVVRSALDIPVGAALGGQSDLLLAVESHSSYETCRRMLVEINNEGAAREIAKLIAKDVECTVDEVIACISPKDDASKNNFKLPTVEELQSAEWDVLVSSDVEDHTTSNFSVRVVHDLSTNDKWDFSSIIQRVVLLDKLREVRAFCGYQRVKPGEILVSPAGRHEDIKWLPAIQVFGEGVFIQFSEDTLSEWENSSSDFINSRLNSMIRRYNEGNVSYLAVPTARLVALHTLVHLLIRQLSFESGYASGSIRERIYAEEGQAGILIYTADSDSEGSLGGIVQQGESHRLLSTMAAALDTASWCSNDPVCSEMETQGIMGLNKAACHSCTLISETSCTMNNLLLDRKLLLGENSCHGLMSAPLGKIRSGI